MPAISTNDLKNGITLELDIGLFQVVEFQHVKPGKGSAFVRSKLRNLRTGNILERTFNAGIRVEQALLDKKDMQFLYRDGDEYVFMDTESYEQMNVAPLALGDAADYTSSRPLHSSRSTTTRSSPSRSRPRSSCWSPRPIRACKATGSAVQRSRPRSRPARCCRCRCSSTSAIA